MLRPGLTAADRERANDLLRRGAGPAETLRVVEDLVEQAARFHPDLADLPRRYAERQLRLVSPRHRHLIPEKNPAAR
jgi:hypothetical protein